MATDLAQPPSLANQFHQDHVRLLIESYQQLLARPFWLNPDDADLGRRAFHAEFALLSHNTEADPRFNYANQQALALFELNWAQLISLPSRYSVEAGNQQAREQLMATVSRQGFIENYSGVRISSTGKRFKINNVVIWNLYDPNGHYQGQAACFKDWTAMS